MATVTSNEVARAGTADPARLPSVLAVVVTHEGRQWLKDCLVALNTQTYPLLDVLVIDDASPDLPHPPHLRRVVKRHLRRRRWGFMRTRKSLGFGGAINWALQRVRTDADLFLFLHDDADLDRTSVQRMVERLLRDPATAIVGPKVVSWDDPSRLEEVGMAVDRFGYPYKGLEEGEIDSGQHDTAGEVFYVTSTCLLIRSEVFRQLRGWDARMRAFSEDLDLCWRARLAGHNVRVEPHARARHAMALATGLRRSRYRPVRYFIRRNRLRSIAKNVSALRLVALLPQFVLLTILEMLAFLVLRQPGEILGLGRALLWNVFASPQTLSERVRVQRLRKVPDSRLRRLTVRETTRAHAYLSTQAQRLEEVWGRRGELLAARGSQARAFSQRVVGWPLALALVTTVGLLIGFRHFLWAPPVAFGELLPYPERAAALWRAFFSPWQGAGLGQPGPTSPALLLLGAFPILTFGSPGAAQKLLIAAMGAISFVGAYRMTSELVDRPARLVAGAVYALGAIGYSGVREGALAGLCFGAAAPFALHALVRLAGWVRPPRWEPGRGVAALAVAGAFSAAFVPGSLLLYALIAAAFAAMRAWMGRRVTALRGLVASLIGLLGAWALLLPWSATWLASGAPLDRLFDPGLRPSHEAAFAEHGMGSVLLGQTPRGLALYGLALPLLGIIALICAEGQRRRVALALWAAIVTVGLLIAAVSSGLVPPPVASPTEAGVPVWAAFAGLAGLAVGAFRLDLPRRGLGIVHPLTLGGLALAAFLFAAALVPSMATGEWAPGGAAEAADTDVIDQVRSLLGAEASQASGLRALWVGRRWSPPIASTARPSTDHLVTGPRGQVLSDLFERRAGPGEEQLEGALASIERGTTDRGGRILGAFAIRHVVLDPNSDVEPWLAQRDLAVIRSEPDFILLANEAHLAPAGVYDELPPSVRALQDPDPEVASSQSQGPVATLEQRSPSRYEADRASGPGVLFLAETADEGWTAAVGDEQLERAADGWANAFEIPAGADGPVSVSFPRSPGRVAVLVVVALAWLVVLGVAFARPHPRHGGGGTRG